MSRLHRIVICRLEVGQAPSARMTAAQLLVSHWKPRLPELILVIPGLQVIYQLLAIIGT